MGSKVQRHNKKNRNKTQQNPSQMPSSFSQAPLFYSSGAFPATSSCFSFTNLSKMVFSQSSTKTPYMDQVISVLFPRSYSFLLACRKQRVVVMECITLVENSTKVSNMWQIVVWLLLAKMPPHQKLNSSDNFFNGHLRF